METGTNYAANEAAKTGTMSGGSGGMDGGRGSGPGGGKFGGGMGAGMGGAGMPGMGDMMGGGGMSGSSGGAVGGESLELPVYQLNSIRRRIKALAFTGAKILGGDTGNEGLKKLVDDQGKAFIAKVIVDLNNTLEKSNVGIVDLDARKTDEEPDYGDEPPPSVTQQLIDLCVESAKKLDGYVRTEKGLPDPAASEADPAAAVGAPADSGGSDKPNF
jgi:hypothetical protein